MENVKELIVYEGTTSSASIELLKSISKDIKNSQIPYHQPSFIHDLESLIQTFYCLMYPKNLQKLRSKGKLDCDSIINFWEEIYENNKLLFELKNLCKETNPYNILIEKFKTHKY